MAGRIQGLLPAQLPLDAGGGRLGRPQVRLLALALADVTGDTKEPDDGPSASCKGALVVR